MAFTVKVDASRFISARHELESRQLPFALAATLTAVAQDAQAEVKRQARSAFKLRNSFTEQGIKVKPANTSGVASSFQGASVARSLSSAVYTDTANRATGAPDYLGRQEEGGEKVAHGGGTYLASPTKYLRQFAPGAIPNELRPKNLLGATAGRFLYKGRKGQQVNGRQRIVRGFVFFKQQMKGGRLAILARVASEKNARDVVPFYILIPEAHVNKSQLQMYDTVKRVAAQRFERQWEQTWRRLYANGIRI